MRVLLVEDQSMVRGALAALLSLEDDIEVVEQLEDGQAALDWLLAGHAVDVVLCDIEMPRLNGLLFAEALKARSIDARVLFVTTFARPGYLRRALDAGARGYVLKDAPPEQLAEALRLVHAGGQAIAPSLRQCTDKANPLTSREQEVLRLEGEGLSNGEISAALKLSAGTVRNYLSEAIAKLEATNRTEAARIAEANGWLPLRQSLN